MKRMITLTGALLLAMAVLAGPALAQSPLPVDVPQTELPEPPPPAATEVEAVQETQPEAVEPRLAETGIEVTTAALLAVGLLGAGGTALAVSRRRSSRS